MIKEINQKLKNKETTCRDLVESYLKVVEKKEPELNSFITIDKEGALKQADLLDKEIDKGNYGLLTGIPLAVKDAILTKGLETTAGSKILKGYIPPYDATVVKKLKKQGAVVLGKANMDEFAMGSSGENSAYGVTRNPNDTSRVPGGSSSGSATGVASKEVVYALGSDTGGSIRQPASFCGVVGLKPTYGLVSRYGLSAMASSLDQIGTFTTSAEDAAIVLNTIAGQDANDATSIKGKTKDYTRNLNDSIKGLTIGLPKEFFSDETDPEITKAISKAIEFFKEQGVQVKEVNLPSLEYALAMYYIIMPAEVSANLARFDGLRYGSSVDTSNLDLKEVYFKNRATGFGKEVKRRIMLGNFVLSAGYADAFYKKAQLARQQLQYEFSEVFKEVDFLLGPTSPILPFKIGEKVNDPLKMYLADIFTVPVNLAGLPAISFPVKHSGSLPIGAQIIGSAFSEARIIQLAHKYETQEK